ncbi:hypothetical protein L9F63_009034, partial [Diploptera punctata]
KHCIPIGVSNVSKISGSRVHSPRSRWIFKAGFFRLKQREYDNYVTTIAPTVHTANLCQSKQTIP